MSSSIAQHSNQPGTNIRRLLSERLDSNEAHFRRVESRVSQNVEETAPGTTNQTITSAQVHSHYLADDPEGDGTWTWPTAALLVAETPGCKVGDVIETIIVNEATAASGEAITIAAGTGGTLKSNNAVIAEGLNNVGKVVTILTNVTSASEAYDLVVFSEGEGLRSSSADSDGAISAATTLTRADSGSKFTVAKTAAYAITLPTPEAGLEYEFMVLDTGANAVTLTNGSAHLFGVVSVNNVNTAMTGTTLTFASGGSVGDGIRVVGIDATHYFITGFCIAAADITIA